jgi:hypothetical protein
LLSLACSVESTAAHDKLKKHFGHRLSIPVKRERALH